MFEKTIGKNLYYKPDIKKILSLIGENTLIILDVEKNYDFFISQLINNIKDINVKISMYSTKNYKFINNLISKETAHNLCLSKNKNITSSNYTSIILISSNLNDEFINKSISFGVCNDLFKYNEYKSAFNHILFNNIYINRKLNSSKSNVYLATHNSNKLIIKKDSSNEIKIYNLLKKYYRLPNYAIVIGNDILYEYLSEFPENSLSNYFNTFSRNKSRKINFNIILTQYANSLNKTLVTKEKKQTNFELFFTNRLSMLSSYVENLKFEYIKINNKSFNLKKILNKTYNTINETNNLHSFLTQGDSTDMNISTKGNIIDLEAGGYSYVITEIAIMLISFLYHGEYFYPKYNRDAYGSKVNLIKNKKIKVNSHSFDKKIYVDNYNLTINLKRKKAILKFLNLFQKNENYWKYKNELKDLKYYLIMRLVSPISPDAMEISDEIKIIVIIVLIYESINSLDDLIEFIGGLDECI